MPTQTILKSLKSKINFPLPEESYTTALIEAGLDGDAVYTKDLKKDVEICAAELILVVCTSGNVSEGGYSLSLNDKASLRITRKLYLNRWGVPDEEEAEKPTVSAVKGMW
jgi:hypothetical protein